MKYIFNRRYLFLILLFSIFVSLFFVFESVRAVTGGDQWGPLNCNRRGIPETTTCSGGYQGEFTQDNLNKQISGFDTRYEVRGFGLNTHIVINNCLTDDSLNITYGCVGINVTNSDIGTNGRTMTFTRGPLSVGGDYINDWSKITWWARVTDAESSTFIDDRDRERALGPVSITGPSDVQIGTSFEISWSADQALGGVNLSLSGPILCDQSGAVSWQSNLITDCMMSGVGSARATITATGPDGDGDGDTLEQLLDITGTSPPTYLECRSNTCAEVSGAGNNLGGCVAAGASCGGAPPPSCGNGTINSGEQCDGSNLGGQTCALQGFTGGTLSCNSNCTFNTSSCTSDPGPDPGIGTVRVIANTSDAYYLIFPDGTRNGWNSSHDFTSVPTGPYSVDASGAGGSVSPSGSQTLNPSQTITFTVTFGGPLPTSTSTPTPSPAGICGDRVCDGGETCRTCVSDCGICPAPGVTVDLVVSLNASPLNYSNGPLTINVGQSVHLYFNSNNADNCVADWVGAVPTTWENTQQPSSTTIYGVRCTGPGGSASDSVVVNVNQASFVDLDVSTDGVNFLDGPITVLPGTRVWLQWEAPYDPDDPNGADSCILNWLGRATYAGVRTAQPQNTTTYRATCTAFGTSAFDEVTVVVNSPPTASTVTVTEPNYCLSGPAATIGWTYSDSGGSPQSAYQVQIDDQGSFNSPEWDSGKVLSSGTANSTPQGLLQFNTTYKARVRVWNGSDVVSNWTESTSWKTPNNAYPQVDFIWIPLTPNAGQSVQFTDETVFYSGNQSNWDWDWLFGDGGSSNQQNPTHAFNPTNTYNVTLTAEDNQGYFCSITQPVNVQKSNPIWKEVNPGG
ncbi:MAG: hypothetical protein A3I22_03050 [Parcubacteria group bacterium RIFCSPLOWO2_02_FULL_40_12]|nr:MAG: hypothetical protein A3I22_03050 [Parcubacteria group bacterium RIFCSPLOWO2_02_FULL_40_12]